MQPPCWWLPSSTTVFLLGAGVCTVLALLCGFSEVCRRSYSAAGLILLGVLVLTVTTVLSAAPDGPGLPVLAIGVVLSVGLGWLGCEVQRRRSRELLDDSLLTMPLAPFPSDRAILPEDVLGPWRFYVDAAARMVTIDLQADGRYAEVIVPNCGERIVCSGGTWTLEGPYMELTSYRTAAGKAAGLVRWFFGDWYDDLILFAQDDPQSETMLLGQKAAQLSS